MYFSLNRSYSIPTVILVITETLVFEKINALHSSVVNQRH